MNRISAFQKTAISGEELAILHSTLGKWCKEKRIEITSEKAEEAARELIDWYQFGLKHPDQLLEMLRGRKISAICRP